MEDQELNSEVKDVENALKRSFGKVTMEVSKRHKAAENLIAAASHWSDGDAKKLVVKLANRYGHLASLDTKSIYRTRFLSVTSKANSKCNSAKLSDLDWGRGWWTDDSFGMHYLHVHHKDGETIHRVYCRHAQQPRLQCKAGKLYWLVSS
jgi:hypothetical protein